MIYIWVNPNNNLIPALFSMKNPHYIPCVRLYAKALKEVTKPFRLTTVWLLLLLSLQITAQETMPRWTHFRGSGLDAISMEEGFPVKWDENTHIRWKTPLPGRGWSSPLVFGDQVWLTTEQDREMRALCIDWTTGATTHDVLVFHPDTLYRKHSVNTYATPTGAIEEGVVYVHFGRYGTASLDSETGAIRWERSDLQCEHIQGPGSSLFIYRDKLIVHMEGSDIQYIVALDKETGATLWRTERPREVYDRLSPIGKKAYTTPIIIHVNGRDLLISNGSAACIAYDPETGEEVWRIVQGEDSTISMPVESDGTLFFYTSFVVHEGDKYCELLAVDPDGKGDIGETHVKWRLRSPILQLPTPVVWNGLLYTVDSRSLLSCLDAETGSSIWSKKLKGKYNSSPVYAGGNIYLSSTRGTTLVFKAGRQYTEVGENNLEGEIWATPAFTGGAILIRTSQFLYKIASP
jgi:outer membrane protein assembly factor BamB